MELNASPTTAVMIALYRYQNFAVRIMHALLEDIDGVDPHTIFFKNLYTNAIRRPSSVEENLFVETIRDLNPDIVGICVYTPYFATASRLTKLIKDNSSALVVWGGIHPTLYPDSCINDPDILCLGEGEGAFKNLVMSLRDGKDYHRIENLWVKTNGHLVKNRMRPLIQNLDAIPFPAYARDSFYFIGSNKMTTDDPTLLDPILAVMPARGCPFTCSYCVNSLLRPMVKDLGPFCRRRSVQNVIAEMKSILATPGNKKEMVEFHDENFGTDESWLDEFEALYSEKIGLPFKVQYNPKLISGAMIERLAKCGLHRLKFGIEAGADHIRNHIFKRPGKNTELLKLAHEIAKHGVKIRYDLIIDNPYDTEQTLKETIDLLLKLPKPLRFNLYSLHFFPDYPLTRKAIQDGFITTEETQFSGLQKTMADNWAFVPKLFPFTKKQILQNIIWLIVYGKANERQVKQAISSDTLRSRINLISLHVKSVFWGKVNRVRRRMHKEIL